MVQTVNANQMGKEPFVCVFLECSEPHQIADPSVQLTKTVLQIEHVLVKSVKTHVSDRVALTQFVTFRTISLYVDASKDILGTPTRVATPNRVSAQ